MLIAFWLKYIEVVSSLNKLICNFVISYHADLAIQNICTCFYMVYSIDCLRTMIIMIMIIIIMNSNDDTIDIVIIITAMTVLIKNSDNSIIKIIINIKTIVKILMTIIQL